MNTTDLLRAIEGLGVAITDEPTSSELVLVTVPDEPGAPARPFSFYRRDLPHILRFALQVGRIAAANAREDMRK